MAAHSRGSCPGGVLRAARREPGFLVAGLFAHVLAFVLLPAVHNFRHRADHSHGTGGLISAHQAAHARGETHDHAPGASRAAFTSGATVVALAADGPAPEAPIAPAPHRHGGGLEHFGAAVLAAAIFVLRRMITALGLPAPASPEGRWPAALVLTATGPRGPPIAG